MLALAGQDGGDADWTTRLRASFARSEMQREVFLAQGPIRHEPRDESRDHDRHRSGREPKVLEVRGGVASPDPRSKLGGEHFEKLVPILGARGSALVVLHDFASDLPVGEPLPARPGRQPRTHRLAPAGVPHIGASSRRSRARPRPCCARRTLLRSGRDRSTALFVHLPGRILCSLRRPVSVAGPVSQQPAKPFCCQQMRRCRQHGRSR